MEQDLELAVVGNCSWGGLVDRQGRLVWSCMPRFDSDPVFPALVDARPDHEGTFTIELLDLAGCEQSYDGHTAILVTVLRDRARSAVELRDFDERTRGHWAEWSRTLSIPFEWQDAVIRAAITLKLRHFEETGAIVAALTTSIPEAPNTGRSWDYRFCWLRDSYFAIHALNRLGATRTMEGYLSYIENLVAGADGHLQPVYGIGLEKVLGERAARLWDQPDAGIWELRTRAHVHTFSSVMCWAACDRLGKIAARLGDAGRAAHWRDEAARIRTGILAQAWSERRRSFVAHFGGEDLDASLLLLHELGFVVAGDPRFVETVSAVERELRRGPYLLRYSAPDDFGAPRTAFNICTFWYIGALAAQGRREEARELFENMLARRNRLGLLSEDLDPESGEPWGNFPQTYSMAGLINAAMRLSRSWEEAF